MPTFKEFVETVGLAIDGAGVFVILAGVIIATYRFVKTSRRSDDCYQRYRRDIG